MGKKRKTEEKETNEDEEKAKEISQREELKLKVEKKEKITKEESEWLDIIIKLIGSSNYAYPFTLHGPIQWLHHYDDDCGIGLKGKDCKTVEDFIAFFLAKIFQNGHYGIYELNLFIEPVIRGWNHYKLPDMIRNVIKKVEPMVKTTEGLAKLKSFYSLMVVHEKLYIPLVTQRDDSRSLTYTSVPLEIEIGDLKIQGVRFETMFSTKFIESITYKP